MFGMMPDSGDVTGKFTEYAAETGSIVFVTTERARHDALVYEVQELKKRVEELESRLKGAGK